MSEDIFGGRRSRTQVVVEGLVSELRKRLGEEFERCIGDHTCVYVTGSCGRGEMGTGSDLDAYIVTLAPVADAGLGNTIVDAIRGANEACGLPEIDGGGRYLKPVSVDALCNRLGFQDDDDSRNLLTKRMLLLLESRPLLGGSVYEKLLVQVVNEYWRNTDRHLTDYQPFVLVNDIVRYWRIVLLNHESKLSKRRAKLEEDTDLTDPMRGEVLLAWRRYGSYKLRFARCLTCFSALTYLLALTQEDPGHVSQDQVHAMIRLQPIQRLQALRELVGHELPGVDEMLEL